MSDTLYIKMDQGLEVTTSEVTVGDVGTIWCKNKNVENRIKAEKILRDHSGGKKRYIISIMEIIKKADDIFQNVQVVSVGEPECVVEFKKPAKTFNYLQIIKVIIICVILFLGAGFSIMSFNNDVSVHDMFKNVSRLILGDKEKGANLLELMYSIGLAVGIIVFYNHFGAKKLSKDPTPIEVEMRKYERDINTTLIDGHNRNDDRLDVK